MSRKTIALMALAFVMPLSVQASEKEDQLIAKVTEAYGGDALINLKSYRIEDRFLNPSIGQSHMPNGWN